MKHDLEISSSYYTTIQAKFNGTTGQLWWYPFSCIYNLRVFLCDKNHVTSETINEWNKT